MKAIVQDRYGSADVLELTDVDKPVVGGGEVLLRVHAASAHIGDWHVMTGLPYLLRILGFGFRRPKARVRGIDAAGRVEEIGKDVTRFQPGDEVFGIAAGSFAEYATAREDKIAPKPSNLSFEQAATVPTSCFAALQALRDKGEVQPGQKVLIIGAGGAVGSFAVQIAKAFGAYVTGVCSTSKVDLVRSIGADDVIDYTRDDFAISGQSYDLILDTAGGRALSQLRRALTPKGTLVIVGERGRAVVRGLRSQPSSAHAVTVREPEAVHARLEGEGRGPVRAHGPHRERQDHPGHRCDVLAQRSPRGHPASGRGTRPRKNRHHRVRRLPAGTQLKRHSRTLTDG